MNVLECQVIDVTIPPYSRYGKWFVGVNFTTYGVLGETTIMFNTEEEASLVSTGYIFLN